MRHAVIISEPSGFGRSSFAREYIEKYEYEFINAEELEKSETVKSHFQAGRIFFERLKKQVMDNRSFILESSLSGNYLIRFLNGLREKDYYVTIIYVFLDNPEYCLERMKNRRSSYFVSKEEVIRRFYRGKNNFWNHYKRLADEWIAISNSGDLPEIFAIGKKDNFKVVNKFILNKFMENIDGSR
jgi:predicted ABC-type ATPase